MFKKSDFQRTTVRQSLPLDIPSLSKFEFWGGGEKPAPSNGSLLTVSSPALPPSLYYKYMHPPRLSHSYLLCSLCNLISAFCIALSAINPSAVRLHCSLCNFLLHSISLSAIFFSVIDPGFSFSFCHGRSRGRPNLTSTFSVWSYLQEQEKGRVWQNSPEEEKERVQSYFQEDEEEKDSCGSCRFHSYLGF